MGCRMLAMAPPRSMASGMLRRPRARLPSARWARALRSRSARPSRTWRPPTSARTLRSRPTPSARAPMQRMHTPPSAKRSACLWACGPRARRSSRWASRWRTCPALTCRPSPWSPAWSPRTRACCAAGWARSSLPRCTLRLAHWRPTCRAPPPLSPRRPIAPSRPRRARSSRPSGTCWRTTTRPRWTWRASSAGSRRRAMLCLWRRAPLSRNSQAGLRVRRRRRTSAWRGPRRRRGTRPPPPCRGCGPPPGPHGRTPSPSCGWAWTQTGSHSGVTC
mmetsp:Transcript_78/g.146  ORF Transcript_78/g.146 Transcript_78/m.146 type:complete len:276 (+) Transcript_78:995-1822(+)